jgi:ferritin-like metal-binding protein YciE
MKTFKPLFLHLLQEIVAATESSNLRASLADHIEEIKTQIAQLERVFEAIGEPVKDVTCEAVLGMLPVRAERA